MADPTPLYSCGSPAKASTESLEFSEYDRSSPTSDRTLIRLRSYLCILNTSAKNGKVVISSGELAEKVGVKPGLVRKDLCRFGGFGRPSVGYNVAYLQKKIGEILHIGSVNKIAWVGGMGDSILLQRLTENNYTIAAAFGSGPDERGTEAGLVRPGDPKSITETISALGLRTAVLAGGDGIDPQSATEAMIAGGIRAILNLTSTFVSVPPGIFVRNTDLLGEIMMLSYYCGDSKQETRKDAIMQGNSGDLEGA